MNGPAPNTPREQTDDTEHTSAPHGTGDTSNDQLTAADEATTSTNDIANSDRATRVSNEHTDRHRTRSPTVNRPTFSGLYDDLRELTEQDTQAFINNMGHHEHQDE